VSKNFSKHFWSSIGFLMLIILAIASSSSDVSYDSPNTSTSKKSYRIQYRVSGTADSADITISVPGGGTEQREVVIPCTSPTYTFKKMEHAYISAQNNGEFGSVTVEIIVDGITKKKATSSGAYKIATVSWFVGMED